MNFAKFEDVLNEKGDITPVSLHDAIVYIKIKLNTKI